MLEMVRAVREADNLEIDADIILALKIQLAAYAVELTVAKNNQDTSEQEIVRLKNITEVVRQQKAVTDSSEQSGNSYYANFSNKPLASW